MTTNIMFKNDLFFFDQPSSFKVRLPRSRKKLEDVFNDIKDAVNPDLVAYLQAAALGEKQVKGVAYDVPRFLFDQARLSASDLLTRLSLYLYKYDRLDDRRPVLPWTLKRQLNSGWSELTADTQYIRREWQRQIGKRRFSIFGSESEHTTRESAPNILNQNTHSKQLNDDDAVVSAPELKDDSLQPRHRPWSTGRSSALSLQSGSAVQRKPVRCASLNSVIPESEPDLKSAVQNVGYWSVITFQLSSKICREKGWVIDSGTSEAELSLKKVLEWAVGHLQTTIIHRKKELEKEQVLPPSVTKLIHYYGDSSQHKVALLKQLRGTPSSSMMAYPTSLAHLIPQIPSSDVNTGNRLLHRAVLPDGSSVVLMTEKSKMLITLPSYPSGHVAIVVSRSSANVPGYYTVVYADDADKSMLACFTPSGCGSCNREDGSIQFIATDTGGWTMEADGTVTKKWDWPAANGKLTEQIFIQLNSCLTFCCTSRQNMQLVFLCNKECSKFCVGATPGLDIRPLHDEMGYLQSDLEFESKTAASFSKSSRQSKRMRTKAHRRKHESIEEGCEIQSPANSNVSGEGTTADTDIDAVHMTLLLAVKNLIDSWLEHYRTTLGVTRQDILTFCETLQDGGDTHRVKSSTAVKVRSLRSSFTQSAPSGGRKKKLMTQEGFRMSSAKYDAANGSIDLFPSINRIASSYTASDVAPVSFSVDVESINATAGLCPFILRHTLLGNLTTTLLKCSHRTIPHIGDVEFDVFMRTFAPRDQLIVVSIVSTMCPEATPFLETLEEIYAERCRRRLLPCVQSHNDSYRLLLYDTMTAAAQTGRPQPLLSRRHNVVAGMFLIYCNGRLVYCDHIFNGYGWDHKDFLKQLDTTRSQATKGNSLPDDFMFMPPNGTHGLRAAWGGDMGGVGLCDAGNAHHNEMTVM